MFFCFFLMERKFLSKFLNKQTVDAKSVKEKKSDMWHDVTHWIRFSVLLLVVWTKTNERNMCSQLDLVFFQRLCLHNFIQCLTLYWLKYEFSDVWHHCHGYKNVSLGHAVQTEHKARERERESWKSCTVVCMCNIQAVCSGELHWMNVELRAEKGGQTL